MNYFEMKQLLEQIGKTDEEMEMMWNYCLEKGHSLISQLDRSGVKWHEMNIHALKTLEEEYYKMQPNETILKIQEIFSFDVDDLESIEWGKYDGFLIQTDQHKYYILIHSYQDCCEDWGYFASDDDFENYIGANLREVRITDTALNQTLVDEKIGGSLDAGGIQFVDFVTDKGVLQFAVYNGHNGYYGHSIKVLKNSEVLVDDVL